MKVEFRDRAKLGEEKMEVFAEAERPAFLVNIRHGYREKFGEYDFIMSAYEYMRDEYVKAGFQQLADELAVIEVEPNQELIDELFQSSGRMQLFIRDFVEKANLQ